MFRISDFYLKRSENKNRGSLEIVNDMLSVATQKSKKTRILYDAHLNHRLLEKYLKILLGNGLLHITDDSYYKVTSKGKNFLQKYQEYQQLCHEVKSNIKNAKSQKQTLKDICFNNIENE